MNTPPVTTQIRRLIANSPLSIKEIADEAGVPYQPLQRFVRGATPSYNALSAELVYHFFTGRSFTEHKKPLMRARGRRVA